MILSRVPEPFQRLPSHAKILAFPRLALVLSSTHSLRNHSRSLALPVLWRMASTQADPAAKPMSEKQRLKLEKFAKKKQAQEALQAQQQGNNSTSKAKKAKAQEAPTVQSKDWVEETPAGQKKILKSLDDDFTKSYLPTVVESAWYSFWEKERLFEPRTEEDGSVKSKGKYVIAIPPPNVCKSRSPIPLVAG